MLAGTSPFGKRKRDLGLDSPAEAETMIGMQRLTSLQNSVETVLADDIPGDLIECGVWRGGACILMRAVLAAYGDETRCVWVADSFAGLPRPDPANYKADKGIRLDRYAPLLAVPEAEVRTNFQRYGLLDDQVRFLPGWFKDTLPDAPIDRIAVLRLDGDLYESKIQALDALYPRLSPGVSASLMITTRSRRVGKLSPTTARNMEYPRRSLRSTGLVCCGANNDDHLGRSSLSPHSPSSAPAFAHAESDICAAQGTRGSCFHFAERAREVKGQHPR
jgi:hypothetical protein